MQYRSVSDLNSILKQHASVLCREIDVVVGIPRSGLLAANLLALHANLPVADLEGFLAGRLLGRGSRGIRSGDSGFRRALIIDDSVFAGTEMRKTRERIQSQNVDCEIVYAAAYIAPGKESCVDRFAEVCDVPRVFEWNVMHHSVLGRACVDIDGVLCRDPREEENDDGPRYRNFIESVEPRIVPTGMIDTLVTCRLEKYRNLTEAWLQRSEVQYRRLVMLDLPNAAARRRWARHGEYKGEVYRESENVLFIESSTREALAIADTSVKPVLAVDRNEMIWPGTAAAARGVVCRLPSVVRNRMARMKAWMLKRVRPESFGRPLPRD